MSVINEVVEAVMDLMNGLEPFADVTRGALPTGRGIVCEVGPSLPATVYMDKNSYVTLDLTVNGKHEDLKTLSDALNDIHAVLTRMTSYPAGADWAIIDIETGTLPSRIGREDNNDWLMASSLSVRFYMRGDGRIAESQSGI